MTCCSAATGLAYGLLDQAQQVTAAAQLAGRRDVEVEETAQLQVELRQVCEVVAGLPFRDVEQLFAAAAHRILHVEFADFLRRADAEDVTLLLGQAVPPEEEILARRVDARTRAEVLVIGDRVAVVIALAGAQVVAVRGVAAPGVCGDHQRARAAVGAEVAYGQFALAIDLHGAVTGSASARTSLPVDVDGIVASRHARLVENPAAIVGKGHLVAAGAVMHAVIGGGFGRVLAGVVLEAGRGDALEDNLRVNDFLAPRPPRRALGQP